jgi:hypothetical protein
MDQWKGYLWKLYFEGFCTIHAFEIGNVETTVISEIYEVSVTVYFVSED